MSRFVTIFTLTLLALFSLELAVVTRAIAGVVFFLLTAPVSAHLLAKASYEVGEAMPIQLHDGSTIVFRKIDEEYDLTSRASAFKYLRERFNAGEITTGLLYLNESRAEMHELLGNVDTPLSQLPLDDLIPGSEALKKLQNRYR